MSEEQLLSRITIFINDIGINCEEGIVDQHTFLPGVDIVNGEIIYDSVMMDSYGDLLHEAGHIAVLKKDLRAVVTSPDVWGDLGEENAEVSAIAWSWAAAEYLNIPPEVVFHNEGYRGGADSIIDRFRNHDYVGVNLLEDMGMTRETSPLSDQAFPNMRHWLRP